jgi:predicted lipoprotein with Yx(FWY)xxD motif
MNTLSTHRTQLRRLLVCTMLVLSASAATAADAARGIEQALSAALQDKRGITLYVSGQTVAGAVTRIEAGQWVELRSQQWGKIIVRIDRIDGIAAP